jgi:hypothetical protein
VTRKTRDPWPHDRPALGEWVRHDLKRRRAFVWTALGWLEGVGVVLAIEGEVPGMIVGVMAGGTLAAQLPWVSSTLSTTTDLA